MKTTLLACLLLFFCTSIFSQDTYTNQAGKIIPGTIENNREWNLNPTHVTFRESAAGSTITLTPQNCNGFTAGQDTFISYSGSRVRNTDDAGDISGYKSGEIKKDSIQVFLRQIYRYNNYVLYKYQDERRMNFYFTDGGAVRELEYYEYIKSETENTNTGSVVPYNGYKQYLFQELTGTYSRNLSARLNTVTYKENSLINFLASVFHDKGRSTVTKRNHYPAEIFAGLSISANMGSMLDPNEKVIDKQTTYTPTLEVGLRLYSQRNFGKLFFQPSVNAMPLSQKFYNNYYKLTATLIGANLGVGYMFVKQKKLSVFAVANGSLYIPAGLTTTYSRDNVHNTVKSDLTERLTVRPEIGLVINQKINILASGFFPLRLSFDNNTFFRYYKLTQLSFGFRYAFIQNKK